MNLKDIAFLLIENLGNMGIIISGLYRLNFNSAKLSYAIFITIAYYIGVH